MRVLVTGAFGFLGRATVDRLHTAGHEVVALANASSAVAARAPAGVTVRRADIRDVDGLAAAALGVQAVCHLAARTTVRGSFEDPLRSYDVNVGGTIALLEALRRSADVLAPIVVFTSSAAVYGDATSYPVPEDAPARPTTPYARTKVAVEGLLDDAARAGSIGAVVLRVANVAGAHDGRADEDRERIIPKAVAVAAGHVDHVEVNGTGASRRDYVHVLDVADACVAALDHAAIGRNLVCNIGSGRAVSVAEVLAMTEQVSGRPVVAIHRPAVVELPLVYADIRRAHERLGWQPHRSELRRLIADAWEAVSGDALP